MADDKTVRDAAPFGANPGATSQQGAPAQPSQPGASQAGYGYPPAPLGGLAPNASPSGSSPFGQAASPPVKESTFSEIRGILKDFVKRNEKVMWWLHTAYALALGAFVATFAQKGFERARLLALSLTAAWLLVVFFFRFFGTGTQQDFMTAWPGARRRFFIMSYFMKNLFQSMLFFLLPFYWKSSSYSAGNYAVFAGLAVCAVLSTLDLVFDRVLLRFKLVASAFFALTLFGCANLVIPALLPETPIIVVLLVAGGLALTALVLFHVALATLKKPVALAAFAAFLGLGMLGLYSGRTKIPPVPVYLVESGVGTKLRDDGKLESEIAVIRSTSLTEDGTLYAVAEVSVVGEREQFRHVWKKNKEVLKHAPAEAAPPKDSSLARVASQIAMSDLPEDRIGKYTIDVVTTSDQIVGRITFEIRE